MNLAEIVREVQQLSDEDRKELLRLLLSSAARDPREKRHSILEFEGIGASLYKGENDLVAFHRAIAFDPDTRPRDILEFEGIAAHARGEDAQEYINRLRDEWDDRL